MEASEVEREPPKGRSFVIGCGIGAFVSVLAVIVLWTGAKKRATERAERTKTLLGAIGRQLDELPNPPLAGGLGDDFSGQRALQKAGVRAPEAAMSRGLALDAWGEALRYRNDGESAKLYSCGPNSRDDGGGFDDLLYSSRRRKN